MWIWMGRRARRAGLRLLIAEWCSFVVGSDVALALVLCGEGVIVGLRLSPAGWTTTVCFRWRRAVGHGGTLH